jgi:cytochrome c553
MPSKRKLHTRALVTASLVLTTAWIPWPVRAQAAVQGKAVANANIKAPERAALCMACHGPQGVSQIPNIPSLAAQPKTYLENKLVLIREGLRDIPAMKGALDGVPDTELIALAQYFSAQTAPKTSAAKRDMQSLQRGQELAKSALCGTCHLPDHRGRDQVPRLASQHETYLHNVMKEYRDNPGPGRDTVMAAALYGINDAQLKDLAHFFAHSP